MLSIYINVIIKRVVEMIVCFRYWMVKGSSDGVYLPSLRLVVSSIHDLDKLIELKNRKQTNLNQLAIIILKER